MALSKSPGDEPDQKTESKEQDYFDKYLRLERSPDDKNWIAKQSPDDTQYDPELRSLLTKLTVSVKNPIPASKSREPSLMHFPEREPHTPLRPTL
jgi:hypothetical protein